MKSRLIFCAAVVLLLVQLGVQFRLAKLDSQTTDEAVHISAGYTYVTRGDFRFNPEHPPLVKELVGLAILHLHPKISPAAEKLYDQSDSFFYDSWRENREFGELLLYGSGNNPDQILLWARLPIVLLTFILGLSILLIATQEWGPMAGLVATALYALDPLVNAHGHLVTTDVAVALGYLLAIYTGWKLLVAPSWRRGIYFGLSLALALLVKHTAVIIFPALVVLITLAWQQSADRHYLKKLLPKLLLSFFISWVLIWAAFGFHDRVVPATTNIASEIISTNNNQVSDATTSRYEKLDRLYAAVRPVLDLLPGDYAKGVFMVFTHVDGGQTAFLLGQTSNTGWWYYFPAVIFFKTPIPSLLLIGLGLYVIFRRRPRDRLTIGLITGAAVFLGVAMLSKANLGVRHVLPMFPLLFIAAGLGYTYHQKLRPIFWVLLVWLGMIYVFAYPGYLGYFNSFAGGSSNGYKIATDSNLDWGQDIYRIKRYISDYHLTNVYLEYGWDGQPSLDYYFGANGYKNLSEYNGTGPGWAIIGASAFNDPGYAYLRDCSGFQEITSGTFACPLPVNK